MSETRVRVVTARFDGRCTCCGCHIRPGDPISKSLHGWEHNPTGEGCPGDLSDADVEECAEFLADAGDR